MVDPDKSLDGRSADAQPGKPDAQKLWNVFGLQVARRTEIIALAAFMLSLSGVLWQVFNYTRGAVVRLFPPDQIVILATDTLGHNYAGQQNMLALIATMAYVNDGETGQNAIIRGEYISVSLGAREVEHRWYEFGNSDVADGALLFRREGVAHPFPAIAASYIIHETLFAPWENVCVQSVEYCDVAKNFVKWDDFISAIKANPRLIFTARAEIYPSKKISVSCPVRLRDWEIAVLENQKWLTTTCIDSDATGQPQRRARSAISASGKK
jgi:hypothetical protein